MASAKLIASIAPAGVILHAVYYSKELLSVHLISRRG